MSSNFKKLAIAAGVSAGLAAVSVPSYAVIPGPAGEALLIPLVAHGGDVAGGSNTIIQVTIPGTVGFDSIPNDFTAPNTTPTNPGPTLFPVDADLVPGNAIHWYWFDKESVHRLNRMVPVTADDVVVIDWLQASGGSFAGQEGYMVIGTEIARTGAAADFAMFGEAWFELYSDDTADRVGTLAQIPVLPMSDGVDGAFDSPVSKADNVKYNSAGIPRAVSPLISGMRTNRSDGILNDTTVFNLALSDRNFPSVHVVWLDVNLDDDGRGLGVDVFDSDEFSCSGSVDLPYELNVIWIPEAFAATTANPFGIPSNEYCLPTQLSGDEIGFVTYYIPEYIDTNIDEPESAGVAFSILMDWDAVDNLRFTTSLGQERGTYK
ncbi:hypothetical protein [Thiocapsa marina]|uniref:PEP-CTERM sorting domain-containing protein n=1 Tax=Thiocapsa marina 5811 TaxID=768671 RepID=F9U9C5_9GAMM|nr:hypothetical protein [Thiocapsa marina]EGV19383.1 hypothetical protein ThimaDRAFT_1527 [Thiocapsa marina 5811]